MVKEMGFGRNYTMTVENEKISGILLDLKVLKKDADGNHVVSEIVDLNQVSIDIKVTRKGQTPFFFHQGYLDHLLIGLFAQTTYLDIAKKPFEDGYNMVIDFNGVLQLNRGDLLEVNLNFKTSAFDSVDTSISSLAVETIPTTNAPTPLPYIKVKGIGNGNVNIHEQLPDDLLKLVVVTDYKNSYSESDKAKIDTFLLTGLLDNEINGSREQFKKSVSHNLLIAQNRNMFDNNPESIVKNMVLYMSENELDSSELTAKLTKPADNDAVLISVHRAIY